MSEDAPEVAQAAALGWVPKEKFRGNPDHWVDAPEFLEKGKTILPILKQNNQALQGTVAQQAAELAALKQAVDEGKASMEEFRKFHSEEMKRQVEKTKRELRVGIEEARKEGDINAAVEMQEQLEDLTTSQAALAPPAKPAEKPAPTAPALDPTFLAWKAENPWFETDPVKTALMVGVAQKMRADGNQLTGRDFFNAVTAAVEDYGSHRKADKMEGGQGGGGGRSADTGSFSSLPAEAKAYAKKQATKFVGPNKMFKTEAEWNNYYAEQYNAAG